MLINSSHAGDQICDELRFTIIVLFVHYYSENKILQILHTKPSLINCILIAL